MGMSARTLAVLALLAGWMEPAPAGAEDSRITKGREELARGRKALEEGEKRLAALRARRDAAETARLALGDQVKAEGGIVPPAELAAVEKVWQEAAFLLWGVKGGGDWAERHLVLAQRLVPEIRALMDEVGAMLTAIQRLLDAGSLLQAFAEGEKAAAKKAQIEAKRAEAEGHGKEAEALIEKAEAKLKEAKAAFDALRDKYKTSVGPELADATLLYMGTLASMLAPAPEPVSGPELAVGFSALLP